MGALSFKAVTKKEGSSVLGDRAAKEPPEHRQLRGLRCEHLQDRHPVRDDVRAVQKHGYEGLVSGAASITSDHLAVFAFNLLGSGVCRDAHFTNACHADETLSNVEVLIENEGYAAVTRQCGGERVEERGECWRRGLNEAVPIVTGIPFSN